MPSFPPLTRRGLGCTTKRHRCCLEVGMLPGKHLGLILMRREAWSDEIATLFTRAATQSSVALLARRD
jgi:hypothetical protein